MTVSSTARFPPEELTDGQSWATREDYEEVVIQNMLAEQRQPKRSFARAGALSWSAAEDAMLQSATIAALQVEPATPFGCPNSMKAPGCGIDTCRRWLRCRRPGRPATCGTRTARGC